MTTIYDVAARAGVSVATVSRVINRHATVNSRLAEQVRQAIAELDYRPSRVARSLRTRRTMTVAVIVPDIENPFFTAVVHGIEQEARDGGLMVMLCHTDDDADQEAAYLDLAVDQRMDGVILASSRDHLGDFHRAGRCAIPTVLVDREIAGVDVDTVLVDNVQGAFEATTHLLDQGANRVACISGTAGATTSEQRLEGYLLALDRRGGGRATAQVHPGGFRVAGGRAAVAELVAGSAPPDALLVCNNQMTMGALQELADRHVRLPDDVLLVGFDDEPWARYWHPTVSTVAQPAREVGATAMRLLLDRLGATTARAAHHVRLAPSLIPRGSSQRAIGGSVA